MSTSFLLWPNKRQHNFIRQFITVMYSEMLNCSHSKPLADHRIPLGQQNDFRCAIFEIIEDFTPITVAVRKIFVDCSGDFLASFFVQL